METAKVEMTLERLVIGSRLLVRSKTDWRHASVSRLTDEKVVLTVCSPSGRTYRLRRDADSEVVLNGEIPVLTSPYDDDWYDNFGKYDARW